MGDHDSIPRIRHPFVIELLALVSTIIYTRGFNFEADMNNRHDSLVDCLSGHAVGVGERKIQRIMTADERGG